MKQASPRYSFSTLVVCCSLLVALAITMLPNAGSVAYAAATISGRAYRDYNANGVIDSLEPGLSGVTVTVYNASNAVVGTATTNATGNYTINDATAYSGPYRVEFTNAPSTVKSGPMGSNSGSTVLFLSGGSTAANMGFNNPANYCQDNPTLVTNCYSMGHQDQAPSAAFHSIVGFPYTAGSTQTLGIDSPAPSDLAFGAETGPTFGLAWQRSSKSLFASSVMKRHVGFGPNGTGAIYRITPSPRTVSLFLDLNALFGANTAGANPHPTGTDLVHDSASWDPVGKISLGDMDISEDETTLWTVNLASKQLYKIPIGLTPTAPTAAAISRYTVPAPADCAVGDNRPYALAVNEGFVYLGMVCSAQSTANAANLRGYVYQFNPTSTTFTQVLNFPLNHTRGCAVVAGGCTSAVWNPWRTNFTVTATGFGGEYVQPQPMLTDIEFDNGNMILGIRDRFSDQMGFNQNNTTAGSTTLYIGDSAGDILRACGNGSSWTLEANGSCGGTTTAGAGTNQGPGGGEYYYRDNYPEHDEIPLGGLLQIPGKPDVVQTIYDPIFDATQYFDGGILWLNNSTGNRSRAYRIYDSNAQQNTLAKAGGLGDLEALCDAAPIEIGNRIWNDANNNGIQDAGEQALSGVAVRLFDTNGTTVLATATTDANGNYRFSSLAGTNTGSTIFNITGLQPNRTGYSIRVASAQAALANKNLTITDFNSGANSDLRDSDATISGADAVITFNTGVAGDNNHSYDIGFYGYSVGNRVWFDTNNNGTLDASEQGISGVSVSLFADADANGVPDSGTALATQNTTANGCYRFDGLAANSYVVRINPTNFNAGNALAGYRSSTITAASANNNLENDDNGVEGANLATDGVLSQVITLGGSEPTTETNLCTGDPAEPDATTNLTVDFGFFKLSLGNRVWNDVNNNGLLDVGEAGIDNVNVAIYNASNVLIASTTTSGGGNYSFAGLLPGDYYVQLTQPANFVSSTGSQALATGPYEPAPDPDNNINNDDNGTTNGAVVRSALITLTPASTGAQNATIVTNATGSTDDTTLDFGLFQPLALGNHVWNDVNNNGLFAAGETGISGVVVNLYRAGSTTVLTSTTTNATGYYHFSMLGAGNYEVELAASNFSGAGALVGYTSSTGTFGSISGPYETAPDPNTNIDSDDNGEVIGALGTTGVIRSASITLAAGSEPTGETNGSNDTTLDANSNLTLDFGVFANLSLGNRVWNDANNDGLRNNGEAGITNVVVDLYIDRNGNGSIDAADAPAVASTQTNASGYYLFSSLNPGNYCVAITSGNFTGAGALAGYSSSTGASTTTGPSEPAPDPDSDTSDDNDNGSIVGTLGSGGSVQSACFNLATGAAPTGETDSNGTGGAIDANSNLTLDFGFYQLLSLGNTVWDDANNDGLLNNGETGIAGVAVELYADDGDGSFDAGDTLIAQTTTIANGIYGFSNLLPGEYIVVLPTTNFGDVGPLHNMTSSTGGGSEPAPDPDNNINNDDNGTVIGTLSTTGVIASQAITLNAGSEPANDGDTSANSNLSLDFGVFALASIGDFVWYDTNGNGLQDGIGGGVSGVTVTLYTPGPDNLPCTADDVFVASQTTSASGAYDFDYLQAGNYVIQFSDLPAGYVFTQANVGADDTIDSDANAAGCTGIISLVLSEHNETVDAGIYQPLAVGNYVWNDANNNGSFNAGETGISGVVVNLYREGSSTVLASTTTNATGYYHFAGLTAGNYDLELAASNFSGAGALVGYTSSTGTVGSVSGPYETAPDPEGNVDNDDNGTIIGTLGTTGVIKTASVTLLAGSEPTGETNGSGDATIDANSNLTVDFGVYQPLSLGNRVWEDSNNDGLRNNGEAGIDNVTVDLYLDRNNNGVIDAADAPIVASVQTNASGYYLFNNLLAGNYCVAIPSSNFTGIGALLGKSSSTGATAATGPFEPAPDPDSDNADNNDNGAVVGTLGSGGSVQSACFSLAAGAAPTGEADSNGTGGAIDANSNLTIDFGFYHLLSLGDLVWDDDNNDGWYNNGETGIAGVAVDLYADDGDGVFDAGDTLVDQTTTSAGGLYLFDQLVPGEYIVVLPAPNFATGGPLQSMASSTGGNTEPASDPDTNINNDDNGTTIGTLGTTGVVASQAISLDAGSEPTNDGDTEADSNLSLDFGLFHLGGLGNYVWFDTNGNGLQDGIGGGVGGILVTLYTPGPDNLQCTADDMFVASQTTSGTGNYSFGQLTPGSYLVQFSGLPAGSVFTTPNVGGDDTIDSDADPVTGCSGLVTVTVNGYNDTIDAGIYQLAGLGNYVWHDLNVNGIQDGNEQGIPNVTVNLYIDNNTDGIPDGAAINTTVTGALGDYFFGLLSPNSYLVEFVAPSGYFFTQQGAGSDPALDSNANPTTGQAATVTLASGDSNPTIDAGLYQYASLGNLIWYDTNLNGLFDAGETGVNGLTVNLLDSSNAVIATTTTVNGSYQFTNLMPGVGYYVEFTKPANYNFSPVNVGANDTIDSDANPTTGVSALIILASGENNPNIDAGIYELASIGNFVWEDSNGNGIQDAGEPGIAVVTVHLYNNTVLVDTQITDANGNYSFTGLIPGSYNLDFQAPVGMVFTTANVGGNDAIDSDADPITSATPATNLTAGENDPTWDAGFYTPVSLGNVVWNDINNNGIVDGTEVGIGNVTVDLYRDRNANNQPDAGEMITTTTTNAGGTYLFDNLMPGDYIVVLPSSNFAAGAALENYVTSTGNFGAQPTPYEPGSDPDNDINNDDNGTAFAGGIKSLAATVLANSEPTDDGDSSANSNLSIDFGVFIPASLGNIVWYDTDADGQYVPGDGGVPGVIVTLYDINGTAIISTTTDANGNYQFDNLPPGNYIVGFDNLPSGFVFTHDNSGSDASDSDVDPNTGTTGVIVLNPGDNNGSVYAGVTTPNAIELADFSATRVANTVVVQWTTVSESKTLGFHLYRSSDGNRANAVRVTSSMIAAQGRSGGASYRWIDSNVDDSSTYFYWLVETELEGNTNEYGPANTNGTQATSYRIFLPMTTR
ncbi:SdrD B-like domain-containing protein [Herpetosiphon llansteffanensis]|uniref:SdrD B-like domain-containing protein n=1 Tax=Herpetosiphon llansteffanensis TaxID=2094568 RepID=UPI0013E04CB5|nr:SdrD B-like domain-containing protein [Herpetosiphon llansteffanensis]